MALHAAHFTKSFLIHLCSPGSSHGALAALCQTNEQTHTREGEKGEASLGEVEKR